MKRASQLPNEEGTRPTSTTWLARRSHLTLPDLQIHVTFEVTFSDDDVDSRLCEVMAEVTEHVIS
jgi:hypothetical protein